jgi:DNA-binding CsgD family transcriptional regulator
MAWICEMATRVRFRTSALVLEREVELEEIDAVLRGVSEGAGRAVLVEGVPGIGKSTVLDAAATLAADRQINVLRARGGSLERAFAWGVVRQLFEPAVSQVRPAALEGAAALAVDVLADVPSRGDGLQGDAFAALHGLYWLTANLTAERPLLLVIDDAQWADVASLRFAAYLAARIAELPVALLLAARPRREETALEPLEVIAAAPTTVRVVPSVLSPKAVAGVTRARLGEAPDTGFAATCHEVTGGNPFLLEALLRSAADMGLRPQQRHAATLRELGSRETAAIVQRRMGLLEADDLALARAVAVLGSDVELRLAALLSGLSGSAAAAAADRLALGGILGEGRPLEFIHPLVRAAVYDAMALADRLDAHADAARLLAADGAPAERAATHLLKTDPAADPRAADQLAAAATVALSRGAPEEAVTYLKRALREPPIPERRAALLAELGAAQARTGDTEGLGPLREALAVAVPGAEHALIARRLVDALVPPGRYAEAVEVLDGAIAQVPESERELRMTLIGALCTAARMAPETTPRIAVHVSGLDSSLGATPGERMAAVGLASSLTFGGGGTADEAGTLAERAFDGGLLAERTSDYNGWYDVLIILIVAERWDAARRALVAGLEDARARGSLIAFARASCFWALFHLARGELRDAEAHARASVEAARGTGWMIGRMACGPLAETLVATGELEGARAALAEADGLGELPHLFMLDYVLQARVRLELARGEAEAALADGLALQAREAAWRADNPAALPLRSMCADALLRLERREDARALCEEELALARRWGAPGAIGIAAAGLARSTQDVADHERAVALLEGTERHLDDPRALIALGSALRRNRRPSSAREPLAAGMDLAHRIGAQPLATQAHQELLATGARPRRRAMRCAQALTPSERRVATLAAAGSSNREIAQTLFVTTRTVEIHLSRAYDKLGIGSRTQLAQALA